MKKFAFAAFIAALGLGACQPTPPPPPPPPPSITVVGVVVDMAGACHTIRSDDGTMYAVAAGVLGPPIRRGVRVQVVGVVDPTQDCPGRTKVRADGGVTVLAAVRMRRTTTVPK